MKIQGVEKSAPIFFVCKISILLDSRRSYLFYLASLHREGSQYNSTIFNLM